MHALPSIGAIIDENYEIKSLLGKGGFGAVYLARHIPMEREVALKLLIASGHNPQEMIQRFRREVMAIRNLSHPNTIRIFDYRDSTEDTLIYYTMEYLKGETLKDLVRSEGPQAPRRIKHILKQILKSLAEAHSLGIIHRDLKPANIMLVQMYGEHDFVKVLDFGIAKVLESEEDEDEPLTSAGMLVGTLRYMSPEQIKGEPLGPFTDIYALGLIVLEMVIGHSVFAGTGRWEILQQQVSPIPIEFPPELQQSPLAPVLRKMLDKDRLKRYPNAEVLLRDLNSIPDTALSDRPLIQRGTSPQSRTHSSSSNSSRSILSGPSTPPPMPADEVPTTISSISELSGSQQRVRAPHHATTPPMSAASMGGGPTIPTPAVQGPPPMPQPGFPQPSTLPSTTSDISQNFGPSDVFVPPARPGTNKKPLFIAIGVLAALLLVAGGTYVVMNDASETPVTTEAANTNAIAAAKTDTAPAQDTGEEQPVEEKQDPLPEEEPPRVIKLALANTDTSEGAARVFLGDRDLGRLPLEYTLPHDTPRAELVIKADGYRDYEIALDHASEPTVEIALEKLPPKQEKKQPKKTTSSSTRKSVSTSSGTRKNEKQKKDPPKSDDWAPIDIKKKPDVPIFN